MVDQLAPVDTCRVCGVVLSSGQPHVHGLCTECAAARPPLSAESDSSFGVAASEIPTSEISSAPLSHDVLTDPDNPSWGPIGGIMVWILSVGAIIVIPIIAVI